MTDTAGGGRGARAGRLATLLILGLGCLEVVIMVSPFVGLMYGTAGLEHAQETLSARPVTAWLTGFFLNHALVPESEFLLWQREIGRYLFAAGVWGFFISAIQLYGNKLRRSGATTGLLYRFTRHPQYVCLGIAGWGLVTIWPRFLLLGFWVTMLFCYAGLARFEERRCTERFGDDYLDWAATRARFLPGNPFGRIFMATFGRLRPAGLAWGSAWAVSVALAFGAAACLRSHTAAASSWIPLAAREPTLAAPQRPATVVLSCWPRPDAELEAILDRALAAPGVAGLLDGLQGDPLHAIILPTDYKMRGMYFAREKGRDAISLSRLSRVFLFPKPHLHRRTGFMGTAHPLGDEGADKIQVVLSRVAKDFASPLALAEATDPGVRAIPLARILFDVRSDKPAKVHPTPPRNAFGAHVVMPIF